MKSCRSAFFAVLSMTAFILDAKTGLSGVNEGIQLCLYTVLPALFPFFVFSSMITGSLIGRSIPLLRPLGKLCRMPEGSESLLLLGFVGGYPVGAQAVSNAYKQGGLSKRTAQRLLGLCSNAGPSFLFGLVATLFSDWWTPWLLWIIQVISATLTGFVLPGEDRNSATLPVGRHISITTALKQAIRVMAEVCGWVILFRMYISLLNSWILWALPPIVQTIIAGILELSNGCVAISAIERSDIRFILVSGLLSFGGLCVCMQTASVCGDLGIGMYVHGKILQTLISLLISAFLCPILYPICSNFCQYILFLIPGTLILFAFMKKVVAKQDKMLYNQSNKTWEDTKYVVP